MYPSHRTDLIQAVCTAYNIHIHYIPPGATDIWQPLDRKVFGSLKQIARKMWTEQYAAHLESLEGRLNDYDAKESNSKQHAVELLNQVCYSHCLI